MLIKFYFDEAKNNAHKAHTHTKAHMANIPTIIVKLARIKATLQLCQPTTQ